MDKDKAKRFNNDPGFMIERAMTTNECVECVQCHKLHKKESEDYVLIAGNVYIGQHGGIIGNNFLEDGTLGRVFIVCRDIKCWSPILKVLFGGEVKLVGGA